MDTNYSDKVMAFDALFTTNHIQMLKILLPALDRDTQKQLAVYIKLLELQYTLQFFRKNPYAGLPESAFRPGAGNSDAGNAMEICNELLPLCSPPEKEKVQNIINMCQNIKNMQEMMQIMEMMKELSPEMSPGSDGMPEGMDIAQTMELLQSMFSQAP